MDGYIASVLDRFAAFPLSFFKSSSYFVPTIDAKQGCGML